MHFLSIWYGWLIFFSQKIFPVVKGADDSYWLQSYLMLRKKLTSLLPTSAEKSIMTAAPESWGKLWSVLLTEEWKEEEQDNVLLGARKTVVVSLYLGNVQFPNISLLGTTYSNSNFQMQYAGCQYIHCPQMGPTVVQKNSATINK